MSLFQDLLLHKSNTYSTGQKVAAYRNENLRREAYLWSGRLSVGDFRSWECCPKALVYTKQDAKQWPESLLWKFELGHAIHDAYQQRAMNTPKIKWVKPYQVPDITITSRDEWGEEITQTFRQKLDASWPEIPVSYRDEDGKIVVMGYADEVENFGGSPTVLDIKSVNCTGNEFRLRFDEVMEHKLPGYWIQTKMYAIMMHLDGYYSPFNVAKKTKLLCVCTELLGQSEGERELIQTLTDEEYSKGVGILIESVSQVRAFDQGKDQPCRYKGCKTHGQ